ncbi:MULTISPECIES: WXG100 family type VII secretion target [Actinoalloteichus]|uniref:Outer membrane channel protein CpnT-like N-terminal domain-containing protein n=1 Tax=Actinoalloteichus fjordicus TaxID=1612552 RepID=A0AAC9PQW5_9PSEU|nr:MULTISPECIES: hypothetical protein [Actinoalloteichus]APU13206.1 hypothetical protein UA74_05650 [Actinoalloteichus fjordicus]APU19157.1 hypothetical protein UA75_05655 [Actinoalloteichus sp. GBA129-24]
MGMELPESLQWVASVALGADWPESDEDKLRELGAAWSTAGTDVASVLETAGSAASAAVGTMQGDTAEQFQAYWDEFAEHLGQLTELSEQLSTGCDEMALEVEHAKISIYVALAALAIQIIALLAAAAASFGTASAGIPVAQLATQFTIRQILIKLLQNILLSVATNLVTDYGIQAFQMARGDRSTFDNSNFGNHVVNGVVAGIGQTAGGAVSGFIPSGASRSFGGAALQGAASGAAGGAVGGAVDFVGQGVTQGQWDPRNIVGGAITGSVGGAQGGMAGRTDALSASTRGEGGYSTPANNPAHAREVLENDLNWRVGNHTPEGAPNPYGSRVREDVGDIGAAVTDQAGRHKPQNDDKENSLPSGD